MKSIHDPRYCEFIEHMITARMTRKVTQWQLAQLLARPQSYVAKVENLDRRLDVVETRDWLIALGVSPDSFMHEIRWWSQLT
ncbi:XRE family transcriptional regulator [Massilia sp. CCM 8733]|uniref:XRE family transcriptional regulator n=1 Tax=Massilia mucilaginosa TaxID=2609282 RepID=A0ABX0NWF0_9BURK|nr:XRE family transcriptional regulator [Massilia mucilaginosa]